jgi:hypothetical protein
MDRLFVLAAALIFAGALSGILSGGLYHATGTGSGSFAVVNRFTGSAWDCNLGYCDPYRYKNLN